MQTAFILPAKTQLLLLTCHLTLSNISTGYILRTSSGLCQGPVFQNGAQVAFSLLALQLQLP